MQTRFVRRLIVAFAAVFVIITSLGVLSNVNNKRFVRNSNMAVHTQQVIYHAEEILSLTTEIESGQRGFVLTNNDAFLLPYYQATSKVDDHVETLYQLVKDNNRQAQRVDSLRRLIIQKVTFTKRVLDTAQLGGYEPARTLNSSLQGKFLMDQIKVLIRAIQDEENVLLGIRTEMYRDNLRMYEVTYIALSVLTGLVLVVCFVYIKVNFDARVRAESALQQSTVHVKKLNQSLERNLEEVKILNKELEAFSYSISHDLRAPLRSIDGYTKIIQQEYISKIDDEGMRLMNVVIKNADRMGKLIDDLLNFSRLGRKEVLKQDTNMEQLVQAIVNDVQQNYPSIRIEVVIGSLPSCYCDVNLIRQVWINLISNAVKYSSKKDVVRMEIGFGEDDNFFTYYVRDYGVGFNMDYAHKLFGVFQRLHKAGDYEGTGVGLAIVQRIVVKHGGKVWAEGVLNEGATFYFALPKHLPEARETTQNVIENIYT